MTNGTSDEKTMAMLCHLLSMTGYFTGIGFIVGPLVIWLIKKDQSPFVDSQGREAMNFNIMITIGVIVSSVLMSVCVGFFLLPIVLIVHLVFTIMAAMKVNAGEPYRYPFSIRIL